MQVGDGGLPGGPGHEFGGDGLFRRAIGGVAGSTNRYPVDAITLVNGSLIRPNTLWLTNAMVPLVNPQ